MKYVMLRHASGQLIAAMGLGQGVDHLSLAAAYPHHAAITAGNVRFHAEGRAEVYGYSAGLKLTPHADDARFLSAFYRASLAGADTAIASEKSASQPVTQNSPL